MGKEQSDEAKFKEWLSYARTLFRTIDDKYVQACSISLVQDQLQNSTENAYMPKVVSMGPLYRGTRRDLLHMEEIKFRCMLSLLHRTGNASTSLDKCGDAILKLDKEVRASYVDHIKSDNSELAKIMLVDGCFLLELFISGSNELNHELESRLVPPGPGAEIGKIEEVLSDLTMLENQIPFVILVTLSKHLFPRHFVDNEGEVNVTKINDLGLDLLGYSWVSSHDSESDSSTNFAHILELIHSSIPGKEGRKVGNNQSEPKNKAPPSNTTGEIQESQHFLISVFDGGAHRELKLKRCAKRLQAAGVTIEPRIRVREQNPFDKPSTGDVQIRFSGTPGNIFGRMLTIVRLAKKLVNKDKPAVTASTFDFDITFSRSNGTLEIPPLHITKTTEAKWRNFIAWEHHKKRWKRNERNSCNSKFTSSALFFNGLIISTFDVQLLKDKKVIVDHLKMSNEEMVAFFSTMAKGVDHSIVDSSYVDMCDDLNSYSGANCVFRIFKEVWYDVRRLLRWLYKFFIQHYRAAISVVLILTLVQTVYAVLAFHVHKG